MTNFIVNEKRFEEDIESAFLKNGYIKGIPKNFDAALALDKETFVSFIKTTQSKEWERYQIVYGAKSENSIVDRFCKEVKQVGLLKVLRAGLVDRGIKFRFVYWKPQNLINEESVDLYNKNIFHCTRQLHYSLSNNNSIDMVIFLNGIPIVSMELKDQFTGQNTKNAVEQYKFDRAGKEAIFEFKNRVLVHFAVDLRDVQMTTRLAGADTVFLPFNQGSKGAGNVGGAGNPEGNTAYLWKDVLSKDSLLEILHKYMHLQVEEREDLKTGKKEKKETMIFPRYHQLDVVRKLLSDIYKNGSGQNYLIQHSAGSGKSNSIAWLAHQLSGFHNKDNQKIFQSVIIVTDRKVLDSQLQDTVCQFDHTPGVVQKVDENSQQLKDAVNGGVQIIISTLQKFPVIYKEVSGKSKNFAIIVDEAHSSQTGIAATKLKAALANTDEALEEYSRMEADEEAKTPDEEDRILQELAAQGKHKNLSFFAFTATPKDKTLQMFGNQDEDGKFKAFHIYSMRQAIEEGFILDVLKNYVTYKEYYKVIKSIKDDPELDSSTGVRAIKRFESLHPHNISQKVIIILEHFFNNTVKNIGGKAKAMVVTPSRLHAVRYVLEIRKQIEENGYKGLSALVAFSGEVGDDGLSYTEEGLNKDREGKRIRENQLKSVFHTDDFNILIVAEKYQTGFDEPYLHTMFVDKKLSGVKAVQTLSRLNRTMKGKDSTFILDFVNSAQDIKESFEPYYEASSLKEEEAVDPNVLYQLKNTLDGFQIWTNNEIENFASIFFKTGTQSDKDLGLLSVVFNPAIDRYNEKNTQDKDLFSGALARFIRIYSFVTQVWRMFDKDLYKFNTYAKFLLKFLPTKAVERAKVDDKILLDFYRIQKEFEGSIELSGTEGGFAPIKGTSGAKEEKHDPLSVIIAKINDKFGTNFTEMDKVINQIENDFLSDEEWKGYAQSDEKTFGLLFDKAFVQKASKRYEQNDAFFVKMFEDEAFMKYVVDQLKPEIYKKLRSSDVSMA